MSIEEKVADHYSHGGLAEAIFAGLRAAGKDPDDLAIDDLAPVDEFHIGGREATVAFAERLGVEPGMHLLDVGSGIGGATRYFAGQRDCRVTGIDLTAEYCEVAAVLADRVGLADKVDYRAGSALDMPFADAAFDGAYTMHVAMNIEDKAGLYAEVARVTKPGGRFGVYDVMLGPEGDLTYPVPWAEDATTSFLATPDQYRDLLAAAGFEVVGVRDLTEFAVAFFQRLRAAAADGGPPPLGLHLLLPDFATKAANMMRNLDEGRIAPTEIICRRR